MSFLDPYRNLHRFIKDHWNDLLLLLVPTIIFLFTIPVILNTVLLLIIIGPLLLIMIFNDTIVLLISVAFIMLVYFTAMFLMGSIVQGYNVFLARKVLDMDKGGHIDLLKAMKELGSGWKHYLNKGLGIGAFYFLIIAPVLTIVMFIPMFFLFTDVGRMDDLQYFFLIMVLQMLFFIIFSVIFKVTVWFVFDIAALRVADGSGAWRGMANGVLDIFRRKKLFGYYFLTDSVLMLISFFFGPLAMFLNAVFLILTKAFIVANKDL